MKQAFIRNSTLRGGEMVAPGCAVVSKGEMKPTVLTLMKGLWKCFSFSRILICRSLGAKHYFFILLSVFGILISLIFLYYIVCNCCKALREYHFKKQNIHFKINFGCLFILYFAVSASRQFTYFGWSVKHFERFLLKLGKPNALFFV